MASAAQLDGLPLFYTQLEPVSSNQHGALKQRVLSDAKFAASTHAVPLTVEEFVLAGRHYPIVFSVGDEPVPLALMGLNEGVNTFIDADGRFPDNIYVPAYIRRYPFMLARLRPDSDDLSLCFDPSSGAIGDYEDGNPLFENNEPSENTKGILGFCEQFEQAGQRTAAFVRELRDNKLLIDGEVTIQPEGASQPFIYRGFQMVSEDALREMRGDVARKLIQSGLLPLVYAHLFSLSIIRDLFARQVMQGKVNVPFVTQAA